MIDRIDLDHVAVAVERWSDVWPRYVSDLGGRWLAGGEAPGFASAQLRYANEMKLEVLAPHAVEVNDFLRRFLDASGPGPHHLTFKVPDLAAALAEVEAAGMDPVGVDLSDPEWKEAFLHPKQARGVVVQLAESHGSWASPAPDGMPAPKSAEPARLAHVGHAVADLGDGLALFAGLLGGREVDRGEDGDTRWVELAWPGPGRVRLLAPISPSSPVAELLGGRPGRVHHLAFDAADADEPIVVEPEGNLGVRLVLRPPS